MIAVMALAVVGGLLPTAPDAAAQTWQEVVTGVVVHTDGGPAAQSVTVQDLHPGAQHETVVFFEGEQTARIDTVALDVTNLRDFENGCNRPEQHTADVTCGSGDDQGELSDFLAMELSSGIQQANGDGPRSCVVHSEPVGSHPLSEMTRQVAERSPAAAPGGVMCLTVAFRHIVRGASDNLTQTDSVSFDVELRFQGEDSLEAVPAESEVRGVAVDRARTLVPSAVVPAGRTLSVGLATTGLPLAWLLGAGLLLVGTGTLVVQAWARREEWA